MSRTPAGFEFDGDVAGYVGVRALATVITLATLGFGFPFGLVFVRRWKARHTHVGGVRLVFTGSARDLFVKWLGWWPLCVVSLGLYGLAVYPRVLAWMWDNTDYEAVWTVEPESEDPEPRHRLEAPARIHLAFVEHPGRHQLVL
jgi:hypothetical protein